jgi:uncharacterized protein (TIGR03067 family)
VIFEKRIFGRVSRVKDMNSMFLFCVLAILVAGCAQFAGDSTGDARLVGEWRCVSATVDGRALPEATVSALRLKLTDTRYVTTKGDEKLFDSTYRLDRRKTPAQIFMLGNEGELTGKEARGIYEIDGERLRICYTMPGEPAPTAFESTPGSKAQFIVWRRIAK